jgi:acetyl-CoA carboxylase biotin carboxyl carrier protein
MPNLDIDTEYIAKLAELLQRTGLSEIEISQADVRIRVARQIHATLDVTAASLGPSAAGMPVSGESASPAPEIAHPGLVTSPMVGTAYLAAEPGSAPFVSVGQAVREGTTLLIIEAMKVMNQIRAPRTGRVTKIFIENAAPVEYGEPLLIIE